MKTIKFNENTQTFTRGRLTARNKRQLEKKRAKKERKKGVRVAGTIFQKCTCSVSSEPHAHHDEHTIIAWKAVEKMMADFKGQG